MPRVRYFTSAVAVVLAVVLVPSIDWPSAGAVIGPSFVTRQGTQLLLDGQAYRFTGLNAYHIASLPSRNIYGCGVESTDAQLDAFFASLRPNSMVRFAASQRFAWNQATDQRDFTALDRVVNTAARHGQRVIPVIGDFAGHCYDGPYKTEAWYASGYRQVYNNAEGSNPLSYWDWMRLLVSRYASSPTVGMWEPMNEAEAYTDSTRSTCTSTADETLRTWYDTVGSEIHRLDPNHLVSSGLAGNGQCGANMDQFETLHQSPGIDVASYHDYLDDSAPIAGDQWNGLELRLQQAARLGKPLLIGEAGIKAGAGTGCKSLTLRRDQFRAKMDAQFDRGIVGFMPWSWWPTDPNLCGFENITGSDPTLALLHDHPLGMSEPPPTTTTVPPSSTTTTAPTTTTTTSAPTTTTTSAPTTTTTTKRRRKIRLPLA